MTAIKIDEKRLISVLALIENHLDGAVTDYENGWVDNVDFLDDLVYVHKVLEATQTHGWSSMIEDEYEKRMKKAKEKFKYEEYKS